MRNRFKNILLIMLISLIVGSMYILSYSVSEGLSEVDICEQLNILRGEGYGITEEYLSKPATRLQAAILTLRLWGSGYEDTAMSIEWIDNFADAYEVQWVQGRNIMGFLKANKQFGWRGSTDGKFYPMERISGKMFYKCILEVLGYKQDYGEGGDFTWDEVEYFAMQNGLWELIGKQELTNRDLAIGLVEALQSFIKDTDKTLIEKLIESDVISKKKAVELGLIEEENRIVSVYPITLDDIIVGENVELPEMVKVVYSNGEEGEVPVIWENNPDILTEGLKTVVGRIDGTELTAVSTYEVLPSYLQVVKVTADNLKEIFIQFSREVDIEKAIDINNYIVKVGTIKRGISKAILADDKRTVKLVLNTQIGQQQKADITIKKEIGLSSDITIPVSVMDVYPPELVSVEAIGNRRVKAVFSEPVQNLSILTNYSINGRMLRKGIIDYKDDKVIITMEEPLTTGMHKFSVSEYITDYAGNKITNRHMYFKIYEDKTLPEVESILNATQTSLNIRFNKPVEKFTVDKIIDAYGAKAISVISEDEMQTYKIEFLRTAAINPQGTEIILKDITDIFGNKNTININVVPELDTEPPEFVSYEIVKQSSIIIEFSEDVLPEGGIYKLENEKSIAIPLNQVGWYTDETGKIIRNKIVLKKLGEGIIEPGVYNIYIDGISDYTPIENKMSFKTFTIEIRDQIKPEVKKISVKDNQIYVRFSEKINRETALKKENYRYLNLNTYASNPIPEESILELLEDGITVVITLPEDFNVSGINVFQISSIKDMAGNVMEAKGFFGPFESIDTAPRITSVGITGKNEIELILSSSIKKETLSIEDFVVTANDINIHITNVIYDDKYNRIILITNENFSTDGRYLGMNVRVKTANTVLKTSDIYGQSLQPLVSTIAEDKYAPYVTGITSGFNGSNTDIVLTLSENIKTTYGTGKPLASNSSELNQFIVLVDEKVKPIISSRYDAESNMTPPRITLTIEGNQTGKKIRVLFFSGPSNTLTDYASTPNSLANFEMQ